MKILFVTHALPLPPLDGSRLTVANLARVLSREHALTLACFSGEQAIDAQLWQYFQQVRVVPKPKLRGGAARAVVDSLPWWVREYESAPMRELLRELVPREKFDVVHIDTSMMAQYAREVAPLPTVLVPRDSLTFVLQQRAGSEPRIQERVFARVQLPKMRRYEASMLAGASRGTRVCVVTEEEKQFLLGLNPRLNIRVIPNGVDTDYFSPRQELPLPFHIGLSGVMNYPPNRDAALYLAHEIMPRVWLTYPDTRLTLIGRDPAPEIRALARDERICVTGTVEDVRPLIAAQTVMANPFRATGGIKTKVLEALAMGKPVVATPQATAGLDVTDGKELLLASDADEFAAGCVLLLGDAAMRERLGRAARAWACEHSWERCAAQFVGLYQEAIDAAAVR